MALRDIAEHLGVSMNKLAQDAIAAHLGITAAILEARLETTLAALREYKGAWSEDEIAAFARSEVEYDDPAEGRMIETHESDPFGPMRAFAGSRGRSVGASLESGSAGLSQAHRIESLDLRQ